MDGGGDSGRQTVQKKSLNRPVDVTAAWHRLGAAYGFSKDYIERCLTEYEVAAYLRHLYLDDLDAQLDRLVTAVGRDETLRKLPEDGALRARLEMLIKAELEEKEGAGDERAEFEEQAAAMRTAAEKDGGIRDRFKKSEGIIGRIDG